MHCNPNLVGGQKKDEEDRENSVRNFTTDPSMTFTQFQSYISYHSSNTGINLYANRDEETFHPFLPNFAQLV